MGRISVGVLIVAALVLGAHGVTEVGDYDQLPLMLIPIFGFWGFILSLHR
ncbi:hypothetical protein SAMN03159463_05547 [Mesorhizobium sp. NFR06]|nr:hypothetical protein [Mesorhizobium sp. NFR06]SFQ07214.1 hypothetical protein SAMN03159463_05547 [Mesorhizobium sp. NFR06]